MATGSGAIHSMHSITHRETIRCGPSGRVCPGVYAQLSSGYPLYSGGRTNKDLGNRGLQKRLACCDGGSPMARLGRGDGSPGAALQTLCIAPLAGLDVDPA